jgi:hypothetical protein
MNSSTLVETAQAMVAEGEGILAIGSMLNAPKTPAGLTGRCC